MLNNSNLIKLIWLSLLLITLFCCGMVIQHISLHGIDPHHQGIMLSGATAFLKDKLLYKDIYYHYGPLTAYLHFIFIKLFGFKLSSIILANTFFYIASFLLVYLIYKDWCGKPLALGLILLITCLNPAFIWEALPWSSVIALFFSLGSTLLLFNQYKNYRFSSVCSGILTGAVFWSRQTGGFVLFFALILYFFFEIIICYFYRENSSNSSNLNNFFNQLLKFTIGVVIAIIMGLLLLQINGNLESWWQVSIVDQFKWVKQSNLDSTNSNLLSSLYINLLPEGVGGEGPESLTIWRYFAYVLIFFTFIYGVTRVFFGYKLINSDFGLILALSGASWSQYFPVLCIRHTYWSAIPFIGLSLIGIHYLLSYKTDKLLMKVFSVTIGTIIAIKFTLFILPAIKYREYKVNEKLNKYNVLISEPKILAGMYVTDAQADHLYKFNKYLQDRKIENSLKLLNVNIQNGGAKDYLLPLLNDQHLIEVKDILNIECSDIKNSNILWDIVLKLKKSEVFTTQADTLQCRTIF
jgi:hypothetical protein